MVRTIVVSVTRMLYALIEKPQGATLRQHETDSNSSNLLLALQVTGSPLQAAAKLQAASHRASRTTPHQRRHEDARPGCRSALLLRNLPYSHPKLFTTTVPRACRHSFLIRRRPLAAGEHVRYLPARSLTSP